MVVMVLAIDRIRIDDRIGAFPATASRESGYDGCGLATPDLVENGRGFGTVTAADSISWAQKVKRGIRFLVASASSSMD
jgi:hypothetical protein